MLANGMGAIDWAGLPIVVALLGIDDVEAFVGHLMTIKHFRPDRPDQPEDDNDVNGNTLN